MRLSKAQWREIRSVVANLQANARKVRRRETKSQAVFRETADYIDANLLPRRRGWLKRAEARILKGVNRHGVELESQ